jgi:hypothetical protein
MSISFTEASFAGFGAEEVEVGNHCKIRRTLEALMVQIWVFRERWDIEGYSARRTIADRLIATMV